MSDNANFVKPAFGQPVLISWNDANTMFHELGHALHGLCSNVTYESLMRHRIPQFQHIFAGDAYAAGYYSNLWAEVLAPDAYVEAGGPYDKATAQRLHDTIMQVGYTVLPGQAYRNFRGRGGGPLF